MKSSSKIFLRNMLVVLFVGHYVAVGLFAYFCHNHEPDFSFHDNCPACQWQVQTQNDDTSISTVLDALIDPLVLLDHTPLIQSIVLTKQDFQNNHFARAPPY